jgi:hypothetical protein
VDDPSTVAKLKTQLQQAEEKVKLFESKMKDAEEDARVKAQEVSSQGVLKTKFFLLVRKKDVITSRH